jgi:excisionase family DNA binding protein
MAIANVTPREVARTLGIRLDAVYSLIWAGRLQAEKKDGRWLISQAAVEKRARVTAQRKGQSVAPEHVEHTEGELRGAETRR